MGVFQEELRGKIGVKGPITGWFHSCAMLPDAGRFVELQKDDFSDVQVFDPA
jgi:hypothetical protein